MFRDDPNNLTAGYLGSGNPTFAGLSQSNNSRYTALSPDPFRS